MKTSLRAKTFDNRPQFSHPESSSPLIHRVVFPKSAFICANLRQKLLFRASAVDAIVIRY
jgi:hypothetical protein